MKYNNTHKITTTIHTTKSATVNTQDHLRLAAAIHTSKIRILPNEQKVQSKAENPKQFLIIVYFALINSHPASFTLLQFSSFYLTLLHSATHHVR
jgi:hypothetical protein